MNRMKMRTQLLLGYLLIFALLAFVALANYQSTQVIKSTHRSVLDTQKVMTGARLVQKLIVDIQTGKRGFIITGREVYLEPYQTGRNTYGKEMMILKELVSDNPRQVERLDDVDVQISNWLIHLHGRRDPAYC
jgi:CHASE3 domain sensor protein